MGRLTVIFPALAACAMACSDGQPISEGPDAGADAGPFAQGSEATAELVINELSPPDDWVELANRSGQPIDLADYFLTDSADRLDHYLRLEGTLQPGQLRVVFPSSFGLAPIESVELISSKGLHVDGLSYFYDDSASGSSIARQPNLDGAFYFSPPTPGEPN